MEGILLAWYVWLSSLTQGLAQTVHDLADRVQLPVVSAVLFGLIGATSPCQLTTNLSALAYAAARPARARPFGLALAYVAGKMSITVDPVHDTPPVLRGYAERYGAGDRWWFLTGDKREIYCLAQQGFRLGVSDPAAADRPACGQSVGLGPAAAWASHGSGGLIMHSARVVLVDRRGQIRAYHLATEPDSMAHLRTNLRQLLAATSREKKG